MNHIKITLADILQERGISQRELSRKTGIRHPTINEMCENKTKQIPLQNLAAICNALDVDITDILKLVKEPSE
ncbi:helix-turn-helix transcriptional regulator [Paenibacillus alvei]|uniref:Helix-turn-helix transcriptional regulator n=1 Tax=Paenibacillus alvei TaxID=44250 RepID=A0ABT4GWY4_PAEAL|nr:helix-turn-helix transcriptional regulator [Paenibacillus alvei]MCY9760941.1 helix-turn-helix transcriptional regulator [Paenibacillus alvei]MCY9768861.1 helix-turn-helix transcriptional regulator [Paenibacillus alvei]